MWCRYTRLTSAYCLGCETEPERYSLWRDYIKSFPILWIWKLREDVCCSRSTKNVGSLDVYSLRNTDLERQLIIPDGIITASSLTKSRKPKTTIRSHLTFAVLIHVWLLNWNSSWMWNELPVPLLNESLGVIFPDYHAHVLVGRFWKLLSILPLPPPSLELNTCLQADSPNTG